MVVLEPCAEGAAVVARFGKVGEERDGGDKEGKGWQAKPENFLANLVHG